MTAAQIPRKRTSKRSNSKPNTKVGTLIMVGGKEDKTRDRVILKAICQRLQKGKLVIASVASDMAEELWNEYDRVFAELGVQEIEHLQIDRKNAIAEDRQLALMENATTVFFTGGDQLRITAKLGGTRIARRIHEIYLNGGTIAGTSAGASVMSEIMLVSGNGAESHKVGGSQLAPGLGLIRDMIIDQHFAQRGRIGRLLGAVAQNPGFLGIGIDEDTAIVVRDQKFLVLGSGAVYVIDGRKVSFTNVSEEDAEADKTMSMFDVRLHVLACDDEFDLVSRRPNV